MVLCHVVYLRRQYHPDKNPDDPEAKEKFQRVSAAYQELTNVR